MGTMRISKVLSFMILVMFLFSSVGFCGDQHAEEDMSPHCSAHCLAHCSAHCSGGGYYSLMHDQSFNAIVLPVIAMIALWRDNIFSDIFVRTIDRPPQAAL